jgi:hypothetical protein
MASNAIASSASVFTSLLAGDCLTTHSLLQLTNFQAGGHLQPTTLLTAVSRLSQSQLLVIQPRHWPHTKHPSQLLFYCCIMWLLFGPSREHHSSLAVYGHYLATATVYRVITWQWVYMLRFTSILQQDEVLPSHSTNDILALHPEPWKSNIPQNWIQHIHVHLKLG